MLGMAALSPVSVPADWLEDVLASLLLRISHRWSALQHQLSDVVLADTRLRDGRHDERRLPGDGARLAQRLARMGADVTHHSQSTGHAITEDDIRLTREWLRSRL